MGQVMAVYLTDTLKIESIVTPSFGELTLTGLFSNHPFQKSFEKISSEVQGWEWDKRKIEDHKTNRTRYLWNIGGHVAGLKDGTKSSQWQSGSISGTDFSEITFKKLVDETLTWTPVVKPGMYSVLFEPKKLFSDFSSVEKIAFSSVKNSVHYHKLRDDALVDSLSVVLYKRDGDFVNWPFHVYEFVNFFTGKIEEDLIQLETVTSGEGIQAELDKIIWSNLSERLYEYIVDIDSEGSKTIYLNRDASVKVGSFPEGELPDKVSLDIDFELFGNGNESGRDCFTQYFPLAKESVRIFVCKGSVVEEWKEVESLSFSSKEDAHYTVDYDLGIITLGGYQAPDLRLKTALGDEDSEVVCFIDDEAFASYPKQGIVVIEDEEILYYDKSRNRFLNCIRGYNDTVAKAHTSGQLVQDVQHGKNTSTMAKVYGSYVAVPRIEYEVVRYDKRTANRSPFLDLKAIRNAVTNNILQISPLEPHVSKIELDIDAAVISKNNLWGPQYYGSDFSRLTARATNSQEDPVEGIDITIILNSNDGTLNGSFRKYSAISNSLGEIYAHYNAPYDWDAIKKNVIKIIHQDGDSVLVIPQVPPGVQPEEVSIFQILKFDKVLGTVGEKMNLLEVKNSYSGYTPGGADAQLAKANIVVDAVFKDPASQWKSWQRTDIELPSHPLHDIDDSVCPGSANTNYGNAIVSILFRDNITSNYVWVHRKIWDAHAVYTDGEVTGTRFVFGALIPENILNNCTPVNCWAVEKDAELWNSTFKDGLDVILYEWNPNVPHPVKGGLGAYYPVRPDSVTTTTLEFKNKLLPIPAANSSVSDMDNILGGYTAVCPTMVEFYAKCKDPISGKVLISNKIRLKLMLPPYLDGVDKTGALPIPYGFGLIKEEHNVSSPTSGNQNETGVGIGGSNFLTINPAANFVDSFSLQIEQLQE